MSAIEWMLASQVIRSWCAASTSAVAGATTSGSSSHASGNASTTLAYSDRIGRLIDDRAAVERLEVDRVDRACGAEALDQLRRPRAGGVELEAQRRVEREAQLHRLERRRLAEPQRAHVAHRRRLAAKRREQGQPGLAQRQVKRGAVERPHPVQPGDVALRSDRKQVERVDQLAELAQAVAARKRLHRAGLLERHVVLGVVDDVLPDPVEPAAVQVDDRADACEAARDLGAETLQRVSVDLDRKIGEEIERGHRPSIVIDLRAGSPSARPGSPR